METSSVVDGIGKPTSHWIPGGNFPIKYWPSPIGTNFIESRPIANLKFFKTEKSDSPQSAQYYPEGLRKFPFEWRLLVYQSGEGSKRFYMTFVAFFMKRLWCVPTHLLIDKFLSIACRDPWPSNGDSNTIDTIFFQLNFKSTGYLWCVAGRFCRVPVVIPSGTIPGNWSFSICGCSLSLILGRQSCTHRK